MNKDKQLQKIKDLYSQRQRREIHKEITKYHKALPSDEKFVYSACSYYKNLGMYKEGLKLALPKEQKSSKQLQKQKLTPVRSILIAQFMSTLGANAYSYLLIKDLNPTGYIECYIFGLIHFTSGDIKKAIRYLEKSQELFYKNNNKNYLPALFMVTDSYNIIGNHEKSIELTEKKIIPYTTSKKHLFHAYCNLGIYYSLLNQLNKSAQCYQKADELLPNAKEMIPRIYTATRIWYAYLIAKSGRQEEAKRLFKNCEKDVSSFPENQIKRFHEIYRIKKLANCISTEELEVLYAYPGVARFRRKLSNVPKAFLVGSKKNSIVLNLDSNEYLIDSKIHYHLPLELKMLAHLRCTGKLGIHKNDLKVLLWPDEPFSFFQQEGRLTSLVKRLRSHYKMNIELKNEVFRLEKTSLKSISVFLGPTLKPLFLKKNKGFQIKDLMSFYSLSKTHSHHYLQEWLDNNWIEKFSKGPYTSYRVI